MLYYKPSRIEHNIAKTERYKAQNKYLVGTTKYLLVMK